MLSNNHDGKSPTFFGILLLKDTSIKFSRLSKELFLKNKHISGISSQQTQMVRAFFGMSKLLFAVLLVFCLSVGSLATTTKPPLEQKTDASKDLCEVSTNAQHFTQLVVIWECSRKRPNVSGNLKILPQMRTSRRVEKFTATR